MADTDSEEEVEEREVVPSELVELSHAEATLLFQDSARSILFAKAQQWKTVGSTLLVFLVLVGLAKFISADNDYVRILKVIAIISGMGSIFILGIYQFWQHAEIKKMVFVAKDFSNIFREIRRTKSVLEANTHRYILLAIMIGIVIGAGFVAIAALSEIAPLA